MIDWQSSEVHYGHALRAPISSATLQAELSHLGDAQVRSLRHRTAGCSMRRIVGRKATAIWDL
jgi:hypothetical protein